jgi:hypothetical protein
MDQTTKRLSSTIAALLFLVIAAIGFFEFVEPEYASVQQLRGQELSQQTLLANEQKLATSVQGIVTSYQNQTSQSQSVSLALPIGQDNSEAIAQIYGIAANSALGIQSLSVSVQPATTAATAASTGAAGTSPGLASVIKPSGSITFQITANGTYEALKTFLEGLESNIRVFDVTGLSIRPANLGAGSAQSSNADNFGYNITVVAYYQSS